VLAWVQVCERRECKGKMTNVMAAQKMHAGRRFVSNPDIVMESQGGLFGYCSFAYSALASFRMGMSGSASFQRVRKSL